MPALTPCLRCLELYAAIGATLTDWRRETGDGFDMIEPLLAPTDRLARRWSRPGKPAMRIVDHGGGMAVAVCDEELTPTVELTQADRVLYRPDGNKLRKRLCEALGLYHSKVIAASLPGLMQVGEWRPEPATSVPVCLAVALNADELVRLILDANAMHSKPFVLLTLTRTTWSPWSESTIAGTSIKLVPIEDVVVVQNAYWTRSPAWDGFVAHLAPQAFAANGSPNGAESSGELVEQVGRLKEMERHIIIALAEKHAVGLDGAHQPSHEVIAKWAGYGCDSTLKATLSSLVKSGFLDNGSHHGRRGGYFLTPKGEQAATFLDQS
jgi:hypothetical protein